jgi:hypothetical protein
MNRRWRYNRNLPFGGKAMLFYIQALVLIRDYAAGIFSKVTCDKDFYKYLVRDSAPSWKDPGPSLELFVNFKPVGPFYLNWENDSILMTHKNLSNHKIMNNKGCK